MRASKYTILIICEGRNTEPLFYNSIKDLIIDGVYDIGIENCAITIRPEPKVEEGENTEDTGQPRRKRKTRRLKPANTEIEPDIPGIPPLNWVLHGQKELEYGTFDEVWVVCDNDNHPARKEAFEEAEKEVKGKKVNIAYSSIAFEYYILLHFERIYKAFEKSECRDGKITIGCMKEGNPGCGGEKCVGGYLRKNGYIEDSTKEKRSIFPLIKDKLETGFENTAWLRNKSNIEENGTEIWDRNPYISTDLLTKRLTGISTKYLWIERDSEHEIEDLSINLKEVKIIIKNIGKTTTIIKKDSFLRISSENTIEAFGERVILYPNEETSIDIPSDNDYWFKFIHEDLVIMFK